MAARVRSRLALRTLFKLRMCAEGLTARFFLWVWVPQDNQDFTSRRVIMQRISVLLFLLVFCFATAMQAQTQAPKPDPALGKFHVWVGHWAFEGETKAGPWGPGSKDSGEYDGQMILGGFFFRGQWREKGGLPASGALVICGYDAANKTLTSNAYWDDGTRLSGVISVTGNTFSWTGKAFAAGKTYPIRGQIIVAADLMGFSEKFEITADGKTWTPFFEYKYTKVPPAAKK